jgi:hypothetical protein
MPLQNLLFATQINGKATGDEVAILELITLARRNSVEIAALQNRNLADPIGSILLS